MKIVRCLLLSAFTLLPCAAAGAQKGADSTVDEEQASGNLIHRIDDLIGRITEKLGSDKPVTQADLDSIFDESFFAGSEDPIHDIELVQARIKMKLSERRKQFDDSYEKWVSSRIASPDLKPEVFADEEHVTVKLRTGQAGSGAVRVKTERNRIVIGFGRKGTGPGGSPPSAAAHRLLAVPEPFRRPRVLEG